MKSLEEKDARSGPVAAAGLFICGPLQGARGGFFTAAGAADVDSLQIGFLADFRVQEAFFELEPAGADEFGFEHRPPLRRVRTKKRKQFSLAERAGAAEKKGFRIQDSGPRPFKSALGLQIPVSWLVYPDSCFLAFFSPFSAASSEAGEKKAFVFRSARKVAA
jgi:hypothetical protein